MTKWHGWLPTTLPGSTARGWWISAVGAWVGISMTGALTAWAVGGDWRLPLLMVPLAASSVILFVMPASPLARPWAIVVGHTVSAVVGIWVGHAVANIIIASGLAVAMAILAMAVTRSLHPPGGSTALLGVLGGPSIAAAGYYYALIPVALNAVLLVLLGVIFHRLVALHPYPHALPAAATRPEPAELSVEAEDIDAAVVRYGEILDIEREDVEVLVREVERAAFARRARANRRP